MKNQPRTMKKHENPPRTMKNHKELDLRPLGKVIIFRDRQTDRQNLPIIYRFIEENDSKVITDFGIEYLYFCGAQAN